jgi:hypothetical protein
MAKKRDDEDLHDEAIEAAEEAAEEAKAADAETAEHVAAAEEVEEAAASAEEVAEEPPPEEPIDEEPYEEEPPAKKTKVTGLTLTLCILNVLAALGFVFMLLLDYQKRQGYTFAAAANEAALIGLGTKEDREGDTAAQAAAPRHKLSDQALRDSARSRGATVSEPFSPVEDGFRFQLYAGEWGPAMLKEMMGDLPEPVGSIEEEMRRLKSKLPGDIKAVADQLLANLAKAPAEKQKKLGMLLFPLCVTPKQVEDLEKKIKSAQGEALDNLLAEAVERRILADILMPIELFRASDPNKTEEKGTLVYRSPLENAAEAPIDDLRNLLNKRLDAAASDKHDGSVHFGEEWNGQKRWTIEKRQNAAFLLVSVAYARKHLAANPKDEEELLLYGPRGLVRAARLSGLYDFTSACLAYNDAVKKLHERALAQLALDREGFDLAKDGQVRRSEGYAEKHASLQFQIRAVQLQIRQANERIADLEQQNKRGAELVKDREALKADIEKRTFEERAKTAKLAAELRVLQNEMHEANLKLADAAENNAKLEERLRRLSGAKGTE